VGHRARAALAHGGARLEARRYRGRQGRGYPRKDGTQEIRAERITAGGKTVELR
jgi:hypothetical protein